MKVYTLLTIDIKRLDIYVSNSLLKQAEQMIETGADMLDLGGVSTRPFATPVTEKEEAERVFPALKALLQTFQVPISLDTSSPSIMKQALEMGVSVINDVKAGDEMVFSVDGPPRAKNKCDFIKIEFEFFK